MNGEMTRTSSERKADAGAPVALALMVLVAGAAGAQDAGAFLNPPADAKKTDSGVFHQVVTPGTGKLPPAPENIVAVHFLGWTPAGDKMYSSYDLGKPIIVGMWAVFPGWQETLLEMVSGEKRRVWLPENMMATLRGPKGASIFELELVAIKRLPEAPANLSMPPANGQRTPSGAITETVQAGTGEEYPGPHSKVLVNYIGWTTDGKVFDSSHHRVRPTAFPLDQVMPAFAEAVQLMVAGEKRRVWIPGPVARGNWVNSPKGMLIFEIDLIRLLPDDAFDNLQPADQGQPPRPGPG